MWTRFFPRLGAQARLQTLARGKAVVALLALLLAGCVQGAGGSLFGPGAQAPLVAQIDGPEAREHRELVAAFGGEYRAPRIQAVLERILADLAPATQEPDLRFQVTILDSPAVNAFALPSGRLYVTRGLLALANDASEVAAVMAHEIAHVTLRHAATRSELQMRSDLVARVVADVLRDQRAVENVRTASRMDIARFSREQEFEADAEGIATLARAGYDPYGATRFLRSLERWEELSRARSGARVQQSAYDMFATHPATGQRIDAARVLARQLAERAGASRESGRDLYLSALEGLTFGDNADDGLVRGRHYLHGRLRIGFSAPEGFALDNSSRAVLGTSGDESRRILFDLVETEPGQGLEAVLAATWTDDLRAENIQTLRVNGLETATASSRGRDWHFRIAALDHDGRIYRLIFAYRPGDGSAERLFQETLATIRPLTARDLASIRPPQIRIQRAGPGDDVATMARRMTGAGQSVAIFRVLNGLDASDTLQAGQNYKIVVD